MRAGLFFKLEQSFFFASGFFAAAIYFFIDMFDEKEAQEILAADAGNPIFAEYANFLREQQEFLRALDVCLSGLSLNPECHKGRLVLARIFYEKKYLPFAVREVELLCGKIPENQFLNRLLQQLSPESGALRDKTAAGSENSEGVIAEADFDFDELEMIDEDDT